MVTRNEAAMPEPPYSVDLIADLHADNLDPAVQSELWPLVHRDPHAVEVLNALDRVTGQLRALGNDTSTATPIPADVAARLDAALLPPAQIHRLQPTQIRRHRRLVFAGAVTAAAAAVVVAVSVSVIALRGSQHSEQPVAQAPHASSDTNVVDLGDRFDTSTLLTALGRRGNGGLTADSRTLNQCLAASGIEGNRPLLGSSNVRFKGNDAVLLLVAGPHAPQITALVVAPDCDATHSQVFAKRDIG